MASEVLSYVINLKTVLGEHGWLAGEGRVGSCSAGWVAVVLGGWVVVAEGGLLWCRVGG